MVFGFLFGWGWKIRSLRRKWDRLREKSLKKKNPLRSLLLEKLDRVENNLRTLEEQPMNRAARARLYKEAEIDLEELKELLKSKSGEIMEYQQKKQQG